MVAHYPSWWCDGTEMLSAQQALCEGNPLITHGFPSQGASDVELWSFLYSKSEQAVKQTVEHSAIWYVVVIMSMP